MQPLCFVLMPFGKKPDDSGRMIDFDVVYKTIIVPATEAAGLEPIRADEEIVGGSIHKPMFERLMLCEYAVADLTTGNANVYYELGIRHALRPRSTAIIFNEGTRLPFDLAPLRGMPYRMDATEEAVTQLSARLREARGQHQDSPVYQFLSDLPQPQIDHEKTDIFREQVKYSKEMKTRLARSREKGKDGLKEIAAIRQELGDLHDAETGTVVDLFLSLRAIGDFKAMIELYAEMPTPLQRTQIMRQQYALALNRENRRTDAERILKEIIVESGPSPETNGLLGRVYKDQYESNLQQKNEIAARGFLKRAIDTYLAGFEADWRDAYPGINAVTLMEMTDPVDPRQATLLPVVRYSAARRVDAKGGDYWDHATLLELAVLANDLDAAASHLADALAVVHDRRESFAPLTTARNLKLIREKRAARGIDADWIAQIEESLRAAANSIEEGASGS